MVEYLTLICSALTLLLIFEDWWERKAEKSRKQRQEYRARLERQWKREELS